MYTLISIKDGLVAHCETLTSAVSLRMTICKGVIYRDDNPLTELAIIHARAAMEKGGRQ